MCSLFQNLRGVERRTSDGKEEEEGQEEEETAVKGRNYWDYYGTLKRETAQTAILLAVMFLIFLWTILGRVIVYNLFCRDFIRGGERESWA